MGVVKRVNHLEVTFWHLALAIAIVLALPSIVFALGVAWVLDRFDPGWDE